MFEKHRFIQTTRLIIVNETISTCHTFLWFANLRRAGPQVLTGILLRRRIHPP